MRSVTGEDKELKNKHKNRTYQYIFQVPWNQSSNKTRVTTTQNMVKHILTYASVHYVSIQ